MNGDQEHLWNPPLKYTPGKSHHDDKFRNTDCPRCRELEKDVQEKQALLLMYREQIKQLQQSGVQLWSLQK